MPGSFAFDPKLYCTKIIQEISGVFFNQVIFLTIKRHFSKLGKLPDSFAATVMCLKILLTSRTKI
jgi:hypothetical protein